MDFMIFMFCFIAIGTPIAVMLIKPARKQAFLMAERKKQGLCVKCGANALTLDKGFSIGKAAIGGAIVGPIGVVAGINGKRKRVCTKCGHIQ